MRPLFRIYYVVLLFSVISCQNDPKPAAAKKEPLSLGSIDALPANYRSPADNPSTVEKIELGRLLFYDPLLSGGRDVSCATCHHPDFGYAESLDLSIGVNGKGLGEHRKFNFKNDIPFTKRNSQSLLNIAFNGIGPDGHYTPEDAPMFWDLRAKGLEEQASFPMKALEEMRGYQFHEADISDEVVKRVAAIAEYTRLFKTAFPENDTVSLGNISKALGAFQRSLIANNSRFDQYMRGDRTALSDQEIEGMNLFLKSGCARCHSGPMLSDFKPHVLGVADNDKLPVSDSGYQSTYAFRTPSLRNLQFTRPYMHNGKIPTVKDVLFFYEDLHGKPLQNQHVAKARLDPLAQEVKVEFKDINAIVEFLNTLNDGNYDKKIPAAVPSGLPVGGLIQF